MENNNINTTGLQCLQFLFKQVRRNVNFASLITDKLLEEYKQNPEAALLTLAENQQLSPELISNQEDLQQYNGPVILAINNGNWIFVFNSLKLKENEGAAIIVDPNAGEKTLTVPVNQIWERYSGKCIIFRNLAQIDARKQTKLTTFVQIALHYNVNADIREIMHEYAVGEEEVSDNLFKEITANYQFKTKKTKLKWSELPSSRTVYPCIAMKNNGNYAVLCGVKNTSETEFEAVILDPESERSNTPDRFDFYTEEEFYKHFSGSFILLKKVYKLSDENQPFSLRWFIPEFIKNKGIFGQIALMVVMLTIFSLIIPLFFQIVVDKVLVNQAYNTLNVLGIGILIAVLFNALVNYIRSYLLLFATNKIDISTATKTFTHLMKLPVDFFDRVPSGVLLKHMQQTEKIRGFLSGNLFFTILDTYIMHTFDFLSRETKNIEKERQESE